MIHNFAIDLGVSNMSFQTFGCNKKSEKIEKMYHIKKIRNYIIFRSIFIIKFKSIEVIF